MRRWRHLAPENEVAAGSEGEGWQDAGEGGVGRGAEGDYVAEEIDTELMIRRLQDSVDQKSPQNTKDLGKCTTN